MGGGASVLFDPPPTPPSSSSSSSGSSSESEVDIQPQGSSRPEQEPGVPEKTKKKKKKKKKKHKKSKPKRIKVKGPVRNLKSASIGSLVSDLVGVIGHAVSIIWRRNAVHPMPATEEPKTTAVGKIEAAAAPVPKSNQPDTSSKIIAPVQERRKSEPAKLETSLAHRTTADTDLRAFKGKDLQARLMETPTPSKEVKLKPVPGHVVINIDSETPTKPSPKVPEQPHISNIPEVHVAFDKRIVSTIPQQSQQTSNISAIHVNNTKTSQDKQPPSKIPIPSQPQISSIPGVHKKTPYRKQSPSKIPISMQPKIGKLPAVHAPTARQRPALRMIQPEEPEISHFPWVRVAFEKKMVSEERNTSGNHTGTPYQKPASKILRQPQIINIPAKTSSKKSASKKSNITKRLRPQISRIPGVHSVTSLQKYAQSRKSAGSIYGPPLDGNTGFIELEQGDPYRLLHYLFPEKFGELHGLEPYPAPELKPREVPREILQITGIGFCALFNLYKSRFFGLRKGWKGLPASEQQPGLLKMNDLIHMVISHIFIVSNLTFFGYAWYEFYFAEYTSTRWAMLRAVYAPPWIIGGFLDHLAVCCAIGLFFWAMKHYPDASKWTFHKKCFKKFKFTRKNRWILYVALLLYLIVEFVFKCVQIIHIAPHLEYLMRTSMRPENFDSSAETTESKRWLLNQFMFNCSGIDNSEDWRKNVPNQTNVHWSYQDDDYFDDTYWYMRFYPPACCDFPEMRCIVCPRPDETPQRSLWTYGCLEAGTLYSYVCYGVLLVLAFNCLICTILFHFTAYCRLILVLEIESPLPPLKRKTVPKRHTLKSFI